METLANIAWSIFFLVIVGFATFIAIKVEQLKKTNQTIQEEGAKRRAEQKAALQRRKTPEYILEHEPSKFRLREIIQNTSDPKNRERAIEIALASKDILTIAIVRELVPELKDRVFMASMSVQFDRSTAQEAAKWLEKFDGWENYTDQGDWWLSWKPKLERKVRQGAEQAARVKASQAIKEELRQAEAEGKDVCWDCETIKPARCSCGTCISGCDTDYSGYCYSCDDDDDDYDYWDD